MFSRGLALVVLVSLGGCTSKSAPVVETVDAVDPVAPPPKPVEAELDRTLWDCEWNIAVFWGPHWYRVHRDVAMMTMGGGGIFSREDHDLSYGSDHGFRAAIRHRDYPSGERDPEELDGPARSYTYTIEGGRLIIEAEHWDEPLECARGCYEDDFVRFMDEHYGLETSAALADDRRYAQGCAGG